MSGASGVYVRAMWAEGTGQGQRTRHSFLVSGLVAVPVLHTRTPGNTALGPAWRSWRKGSLR